jgi:hypothetical protein
MNKEIYDIMYDIMYSKWCSSTEITDRKVAAEIKKIQSLNDINFDYIVQIGCYYPRASKALDRLFAKFCRGASNEDEHDAVWMAAVRYGNSRFFKDNTKILLLKSWVYGKKNQAHYYWYDENVVDYVKLYDFKNKAFTYDLLVRLVGYYKSSRNYSILHHIEKTFLNIGKRRLDDACKLMSNATPAIRACLLQRSDISNDKYILLGLRALSKLSSQRKINVKIDLSSLSKLGPKSRLDAMKQLLGMFDEYLIFMKNKKHDPVFANYYGLDYKSNHERSLEREFKNKNYELPFKEIPTREQVQLFLFPCMIKHNEEVAELMKRFDDMIIKR